MGKTARTSSGRIFPEYLNFLIGIQGGVGGFSLGAFQAALSASLNACPNPRCASGVVAFPPPNDPLRTSSSRGMRQRVISELDQNFPVSLTRRAEKDGSQRAVLCQSLTLTESLPPISSHGDLDQMA